VTDAAVAEEQTQEDTTPPLWYFGLGRRKTAVARVRLKPSGSGEIQVNKKRNLDEFFARQQDRIHVLGPLHLTGARKKYDVFVTVRGGGVTGQAGAVRLGIARALIRAEPELYQQLKDEGMLTRDSREVERKKPGKKGARASFQFSKR